MSISCPILVLDGKRRIRGGGDIPWPDFQDIASPISAIRRQSRGMRRPISFFSRNCYGRTAGNSCFETSDKDFAKYGGKPSMNKGKRTKGRKKASNGTRVLYAQAVYGKDEIDAV